MQLDPRHHLFEIARQRAEWTLQQLWLGYLTLGGVHDAFEIEAYLHGMAPLTPAQQDVLANALNERLDDLYRAARVPYLLTPNLHTIHREDAMTVLDELLDSPSQAEDPEP